MREVKPEASGAGVLSLYVIEGALVALVVTRAFAWHGPALAAASAAVAALFFGAWAAGWPVYARMQEYARDAAQRALHPGSTFRGRMPPMGFAGTVWKIARATVGALFAAQRALYDKASIAFRPPLVVVWLVAGAAAVAFLPNRTAAAPAPVPAPKIAVEDAPLKLDAPVDPYPCPPGTEKKGAPPPNGKELWCEAGGKKNGPYRKWHDDASEHLAVEGTYKDDVRDGLWKSWFSSGQESAEGGFHEGKPDGRQQAWNERGKKIRDTEYKDGVEVRSAHR